MSCLKPSFLSSGLHISQRTSFSLILKMEYYLSNSLMLLMSYCGYFMHQFSMRSLNFYLNDVTLNIDSLSSNKIKIILLQPQANPFKNQILIFSPIDFFSRFVLCMKSEKRSEMKLQKENFQKDL